MVFLPERGKKKKKSRSPNSTPAFFFQISKPRKKKKRIFFFFSTESVSEGGEAIREHAQERVCCCTKGKFFQPKIFDTWCLKKKGGDHAFRRGEGGMSPIDVFLREAGGNLNHTRAHNSKKGEKRTKGEKSTPRGKKKERKKKRHGIHASQTRTHEFKFESS